MIDISTLDSRERFLLRYIAKHEREVEHQRVSGMTLDSLLKLALVERVGPYAKLTEVGKAVAKQLMDGRRDAVA